MVNTQYNSNGRTESLGQLHWLAVVFVAITGAIHLFAGIAEGRIPVLLAGVGYGGALVLFFANYRRRLLYLIGIPYTAVQIPIWLIAKSEYGTIDYVDKAVQVLLILVLLYLYVNTPTESVENVSSTAD